MAAPANKFATKLHRNNNRIVVILVYAILEWVLILLLLLNALFSYLITRFAKFVGIQPPCLWCSRLDHILQPEKTTNLHRDIVCETHAAEISKLGYCTNHQRLAETHNMCEECLASLPNHYENNTIGMRHRVAFISWVRHDEKLENGEDVQKRCSCCSESLCSQLYPPCLLLKHPSWDDGNYTSKGTLIVEEGIDDDEKGDKDHDDHEGVALADEEHQILSDIESFILREVAEEGSSSVSNLHSDEKDAEKYEKEDDLITIIELDPTGAHKFIRQFSDTSNMKASIWEDGSLEVINMHFDDYVTCDNHRLIPVQLIDAITSQRFDESCKFDEDLGNREEKIETLVSDSPVEAQSIALEGAALLPTTDTNAEKMSMRKLDCLDTSVNRLENSIILEGEELKQDSIVEVHPQSVITEEAQTSANVGNSFEDGTEEPGDTQANLPQSQESVCLYESTQEDESSTSDDDTEVQNAFDEFIAQNNLCEPQNLSNDGNTVEAAIEDPDNTPPANPPPSEEPACSCQCIPEDQSSTSEDDTEVPNAFDAFIAQNNLSQDKTSADDNKYAEMIDQKTILVEKNHEETNHQSSKCSESYEAEEDKLPETPGSVDGLHYLHRKLVLFEKRESGAEDSVDGSVASDVDYGDPVLTIDRLKTSLKAERRALSAIYQELEEERSASAVAANQTMAMITRLQEEKAAMQMEALQYQRMMEEQSEYDQEALQLLNELMLKREREKQELEKELEEYRQKVMEYEAKEKLMVLKRMKDGSVRSRDSYNSSCSNMDDTDEQLSIDLNREARDEDNGFSNHQESSHGNKNADSDTVSNLEEMALDCVKHISALDNSLAEFEEERMSIIDQLRELEEKIISLGENEQFLSDIELIEHSSTYGDKDLNDNCNFSSVEENMYSNGFSDDKHSPRRTMGSLSKRPLPYLDEADNKTAEAYTFERQLEPKSIDMQNSVPTLEMDNSMMQNSVPTLEMDNSMKVSVEEEIDHVYERLQTLETDREFLSNCMGSIQMGDKGMDLLQEILQHLQDLKAVELRLKNLGNDPLV